LLYVDICRGRGWLKMSEYRNMGRLLKTPSYDIWTFPNGALTLSATLQQKCISIQLSTVFEEKNCRCCVCLVYNQLFKILVKSFHVQLASIKYRNNYSAVWMKKQTLLIKSCTTFYFDDVSQCNWFYLINWHLQTTSTFSPTITGSRLLCAWSVIISSRLFKYSLQNKQN